MVAAFSKKNTLAQTGFQLTENGFIHYGTRYRFDDVVETRIYRSVFETNYVMVGSTHAHSISIMFVMNTGVTIQVTEEPTWTSDSKLDNVEHVQNLFNEVSQKTWQNRVTKYTKQVEDHGYFDYCRWRFYPQQQKIVDIEKDRTYQRNSTEFLRSYGFISVASKDEGLGAKILRKIVDKPRGISTIMDTDVFFTLLKHYFNLQWQQ